jgi:hypothetical protein
MGRPHKGDRDMLGWHPLPGRPDLVKAAVAAYEGSGYDTFSDYLAAMLAHAVDMPHLAPSPSYRLLERPVRDRLPRVDAASYSIRVPELIGIEVRRSYRTRGTSSINGFITDVVAHNLGLPPLHRRPSYREEVRLDFSA